MNLNSLNKSISEMTDEELEKRILEIRKNITIKKERKTLVKTTSKPTKPTTKSLFSNMSQSERQAILDELESL